MADYIFIRKSRNAISTLLHMVLNLLLAVGSISVTVMTGSPLIGLILIVVSKWRIFAVNHRYWMLNLKSSLVDIIVGVSLVMLAYAAGTTFLIMHLVLMALYAFWLIVIKPRSSKALTIIQALFAVLVGTTAATVFAALIDSWVLVVAEFIIGYAATRHVLVQDTETEPGLISTMMGLMFAEASWLGFGWLIIYTFGSTGIVVSQLAILLSLVAFLFFQILSEMNDKGKIKFKNIALPIVFTILMVLIVLLLFSEPRFNIH